MKRFGWKKLLSVGIAAALAGTAAWAAKKPGATSGTQPARASKPAGKSAPFEGVDVVGETMAAFQEVCLDEKGRVRDGAVTNAELLADANGGAIDCGIAAEVIGQELDRLGVDLEKADAQMASAGGAR